jgi:hypothetical protein
MSVQNTALKILAKAEGLYNKKRNYTHIYQLKLELQQIKQQGHSIAEINSQMQKKQDELKYTCSSPQISKKFTKDNKQDEIFAFLTCLNSSYEAVRWQILLMLELSLYDKVVAIVEGEETRRALMSSQPIVNLEAKAFAIQIISQNFTQNP